MFIPSTTFRLAGSHLCICMALSSPAVHRYTFIPAPCLRLLFKCMQIFSLILTNCSHSTNQTVITGILPAFPSNGWAANLSRGLNSWKTASCGRTAGLLFSVHECIWVCLSLWCMSLLEIHCTIYWIKLAEKPVRADKFKWHFSRVV